MPIEIIQLSDGVLMKKTAHAAVFCREDRVLATARKAHRVWILRIPGHTWPITSDMPIARFQAIPGGRALVSTPCKAFRTLTACAAELAKIAKGSEASTNA